MKIILTGSLGHIGKPLAKELVQNGHAVTVISSSPERQKDIEALGATATIGLLEDVSFLTSAFTGADAVYTMVPPADYFDKKLDLMAYFRRLGDNYAQSIERSGVKKVVHLSSVGAELEKGSGAILAHHAVEIIMNKISGVAITFIRPVGIYDNLYGFVPMIKNMGHISSNYGAGDKLAWVSPIDIAAAIAEELVTPLVGRNVRYVASDELTGNDTARVLGAAIGKPDLKWTLISDEQMQSGLEGAGMSVRNAAGLVEMFASQHSGVLTEDYYLNRPTVTGKVKTVDFAKEFAAAYKQQ
jgi:uncharacterized protein YbjT (DUF2867 family)